MSTKDSPTDTMDWPVYGEQKNPQQGMLTSMFDDGNILDPQHAMTMGRNIYQSSTNWLNAGRRLKWNDSLRAFQGLHPNSSKYLSADYRYRSRLFRPKTRAMVRNGEASTAEAFFANEDVVSITAQDDDDKMQQASAEINKQLIQYRLAKTIPWFQTVIGARQDADVMGICIGKAYWKYAEKQTGTTQKPKLDPSGNHMLKEDGTPDMDDYDVFTKTEDHPWIDLIAPENFRFDPAADWRNPVATSPYTIEMIPMYIADVMQKINDGDWEPVQESAIRASVDLDDDATRRSREQGRVPGKDHDTWKPREFDICWVRENIIRWKGSEWHYFSLSSSGALLSLPRPLEEVYLQGIRPYVVGSILLEAHKVYPSGRVELVKDLQTQTNDVTNLRLDNTKLVLNPRQFVVAGSGIDPQDLRTFNPGKVNILNIKGAIQESVMWDRPPDVTASAYQEQDRLNMDFDEVVGGVSYSSMQANPNIQKTVGNMELMDGNASKLEEYDQRVFAETFVEPLIKHLVKLEQAYETDPVILAVAGQKAQLYQKFGMNEITDELLKQELTVRVNVGIGATNPDKKLKKFVTAGQVISELFGPAASMGANFEEVTKEVFSLCGYKDGERFFMPGFDIHAAQQQMAQGKQKQSNDPAQEAQAQQAESSRQAQESQERMQEMQTQHQFTMQEMQQKFQLEMEKERQKMGMQQQNHMRELAMKPAPSVNVNSDAMTKSSKNVESLVKKHEDTLGQVGQVLNPLVEAAKTHGAVLEKMMHHATSQTTHHKALADAINKLATAHSKPKKRKIVRDEKGKAIGVEEI